ncbi:MAG: hypothetical protein ACTIJS_08880, partial [Senegalia sp. (in: firmicutes)]
MCLKRKINVYSYCQILDFQGSQGIIYVRSLNYKHIKDNLELLDPEKDKEIYDLSTEILQKLNHFLSKHQSDYRRWFDYIINKDCIKISDDQ